MHGQDRAFRLAVTFSYKVPQTVPCTIETRRDGSFGALQNLGDVPIIKLLLIPKQEQSSIVGRKVRDRSLQVDSQFGPLWLCF